MRPYYGLDKALYVHPWPVYTVFIRCQIHSAQPSKSAHQAKPDHSVPLSGRIIRMAWQFLFWQFLLGLVTRKVISRLQDKDSLMDPGRARRKARRTKER